jgi:hypothetical protein
MIKDEVQTDFLVRHHNTPIQVQYQVLDPQQAQLILHAHQAQANQLQLSNSRNLQWLNSYCLRVFCACFAQPLLH